MIFTNRWYALRPSRLLTRSPVEILFNGRNMVLWRGKDQRVVLQDNYCPHRGAKLSMGDIDMKKSCITCPYHGWKFDHKGDLQELPVDDQSNLKKIVKLDTHNVTESGGLIWYCPGSPHNNKPPVIEEMMDKKWAAVNGTDVFENNWILTLENSIDVSHVNFVHSDFGDANNGAVSVDKLEKKSSEHLRMTTTINHKSESLVLKWSENPQVQVRHDIYLPNTVSIYFNVNYILDVITYVTYTPLSDGRTLVNWVFLRRPKYQIVDKLLDIMFEKGMQKAIEEDKKIVQTLIDPDARINTKVDQVQTLFRKMLKDLKLMKL